MIDPLALDVAHLFAGSLVLVSFMLLYQDRMFSLINIFALHAFVVSVSVAWQAYIQSAPHLYVTAAIALGVKAIVIPIVLHRMTTPGIDQGQLLSAYLGVLLMVGAIAAIGVMVSAFFRNSLAAGFVTLALILVLWVIGGLAGGSSGSEVVRYLSFGDHLFDNLFQGVVDLGDVMYFVSLTVLALFIGSQAVESRRWR